MAPLPPNSTARYKVNYTVGGEGHDFQVRVGSVSPSAFGTWLEDFLSALSGALNAVTVNTVEFAANASNIFNPVTTGHEGDVFGTGAGTGSAIANYVDFIGRSTGGRKVRLAVFGLKVDATDYRFLPGENAAVDDAIDILQGTSSIGLAIDGIFPVWYDYANAGVNAYWQRNIRP